MAFPSASAQAGANADPPEHSRNSLQSSLTSPSLLVPPMVSPALKSCPHERRPGIVVCLHCRRDARLAKRSKLGRMLARGATKSLIALVCIGIGLSLALSVRHLRIPTVDRPITRTPPIAEARESTPMMAVAGEHPLPAPQVAAVAPGTTWYTSLSSHSPPFSLIVAEGMTRLADSVVAIRQGAVVRIHFDTPGARTRRADKFEQIVRATLPAVYGPLADSLLARFPIAPLVLRSGGLLPGLPARGLRLPLSTGWVLALWPETRQGQDGPLVVTYRATVMRGTPD